MPIDTLQDLGENIRIHAADPILEKKSDTFGYVRIYPPAVDASEWAEHSWLLTTDHNAEKEPPGLSERIKAKYVHVVFERPYFISDYHRFDKPDLEETPQESETWRIETPDRTVDKKDFTFDD